MPLGKSRKLNINLLAVEEFNITKEIRIWSVCLPIYMMAECDRFLRISCSNEVYRGHQGVYFELSSHIQGVSY